MLNQILSALGLPKRTEINTTQTPALRRIAGLEDRIDDIEQDITELGEYLQTLEKAVVQMRMILDDMQPKPVKPARKTVRRAKP